MKRCLVLMLAAIGFTASALACPDCGGTCHMNNVDVTNAHNVQEAWQYAQTSIRDGMYHQALFYIDSAMKSFGAQDNVYFKYEKARVLLMLDYVGEAIPILDELIAKFERMSIAPPLYTKILLSRMSACDEDSLDYAKELYKKLIMSDNVLSSIEEDNTGIRFRVVTECMRKESFLEYMTDRLCISGACKSPSDIKLEEDGSLRITFSGLKPKTGFFGACESNCDSAAVGASFCCSFFRTRLCTGVCIAAVEALRRSCHWCCRDENAHWCSMDLDYFSPPYCAE